jgi:hypothetical protein
MVLAACGLAVNGTSRELQTPGLEVTFGGNGLERLSYHGEVLEDTGKWPDDRFHIWHMKFYDSVGKPRTDREYGWGENATSRRWDTESKTWEYVYSWGSIKTQYQQRADALNVLVTFTNKAGSGMVLDGASIYPFALRGGPPRAGLHQGDASLVDGIEAPGATFGGWEGWSVAVVAPDAAKPVWSGLQSGQGESWTPLLSSTRPDAIPAENGDHPGLQVRPGQTVTVELSTRFSPTQTAPLAIASDAFASFAHQWPQLLHWTDRRILGTVYLASSGSGDKTHSAGYAANPRRYFNDPAVDVNTPQGQQLFQARVLKQAETIVENLTRMHAQGVITWDLEGEQYPQDTSYVCAPDQIAQASPEMEMPVADRSSKFAGRKLDDAYFEIIRKAGFRVGVCIRPQHFTLGSDGTAHQQSLDEKQVAAELSRKMKYAHDRWGATLFYVDSTVRGNGTTLPAAVLEAAAAAVPDSLLIPEESTPRMYRAMAPFQTFLFHDETGTVPLVRAVYPQSFSANLVNDVAPEKLASHEAALSEAIRLGDVMMLHADGWNPNNAVIDLLYSRKP